MTANRVYRSKFLPDVLIQGSLSLPYISDIEQDAYKGGRTDALYKGNPDTEIYKYDVNSLYPYSMLGDIPIRYLQSVDVDKISNYMDDFIMLLNVTISIKETDKYSFIGGEGMRTDKGELIFPIGEYNVWLWQPMFELLDRYGYIKEIHKCYAYDSYNIFDEYVKTLYQLRAQYKLSGDTARDLLVKILLNSLYGKFGQREHATWELAGDDETDTMIDGGVMIGEETTGLTRFEAEYEGVNTQYLQIGNTLYHAYESVGTTPSETSVMSIAGYITTKARAILWDAMRHVIDNGGEVFYCDTDSIFSSIRLPDDMVSDTELGKWKLEEIIPKGEAQFEAPKHYRVNDKWTIKGIRNPTEGAEHHQDIFPNFITDLTSQNPIRRQRLESGAVITRIVKKPTGINNKRITLKENFPTFPLVMS